MNKIMPKLTFMCDVYYMRNEWVCNYVIDIIAKLGNYKC